MTRQEIALSNLENDRIYGRKAIAYKGGEISSDAGFYEIVHKIPTLPMTSTGTWIDDTISNFKIVPEDSISHCYFKSLGGMTYKCNNHIPFPYTIGGVGATNVKGGITFTVNEDRSFTVKGTAQGTPAFAFATNLNLPTDVNYYLSANHIGGEWVSGVSVYTVADGAYESTTNARPTVPISAGKKITFVSIFITNGTTVDATFKPMLSANEALPYEDYYEGLRDNKPTAIKVHGANFLDIETALTKMKLPYTKDGDNYTATSLGFGEINPYKFTDIPQIFTLSVDNSSNQKYTSARIEMGYLDENGTFSRYGVLVFGSSTTTVTSTSPVNAIRTTYSSTTGSAPSVTFSKMRINAGSVALPYTDYIEPVTYPIPEALQGTGKGVEGASDTIDFEDGEKIIKTYTVVFDGTENWKYLPNWGTVTMKSPSFLPKKGVANNRILTNAPMSCVFSDSNYDRLRFGDIDYSIDPIENYGINSVEDWIDYLKARYAAGDPITVTYAIAEPTETDIDILDPTVSGFINLLKVQDGGAIEIITDNGGNIPTTIIFQIIS